MSPARPRTRSGGRRKALGRWLSLLAVLAAAATIAVRLVGPHPVSPATAEVYFVRYAPGGQSGTLIPVRRRVPRGGVEARLAGALRDLLAGPSAAEAREGLTSEIPAGTTLREVRVRQGLVTVDLTSAFGRGGGSASMLARVWQIVYTASQQPSAPEVQILLDGRRVPSLGGEGVIIGSPLRRPAAAPVF